MTEFDFSKIYLFRENLSNENLVELHKKLKLVKTSERNFRGKPYAFGIVGASHFIHPVDMSLSEILSCVKIEGLGNPIFEQDIREDISFIIDPKNSDVQTLIKIRRFNRKLLEAFLFDSDISHRFEEGAYTAIRIAKNSYETIHTYPEPELNALVYSRTEFRN